MTHLNTDISQKEEHSHINSFLFPDPLPTLDMTEKALIDAALKRAEGNKSLAAHMIGLTRQTLNNWLKKNCPESIS